MLIYIIITNNMSSQAIVTSQNSESKENEFVNSLDKFININRKKVVKVITKVTKTKQTTTKEINHEVINYKDKQYVVCCIPFNDTYKMFVFDDDIKDKVIKMAWHYKSDGHYIGHTHYAKEGNKIDKKELYLHNFVMDKLTFDGKGQQHTIDHINRVGTDNRKCNLREVSTQTAQNFNQKRRERTTELPDNCGINTDQIPKNVYYGKPSGLHGDFFYIELKSILSLCIGDKKYNWKTTKSKNVSLKIKLQQAIDKLNELKNTYDELKDIIIDDNSEDLRKELIIEYNDILKLSHYPKDVISANLIKFESDIININNIDNEELLNLKKLKVLKDSGKKIDNLPVDCGITMDMIPKHCYFKPESATRGCKFIIERHPKLLENNIRSWATTESKKISINDKFNLLISKLKELDENLVHNENILVI